MGMVKIELLCSKEVAEKLMKNGIAEIFLRNAKKRFIKDCKCTVLNHVEKASGNDILQETTRLLLEQKLSPEKANAAVNALKQQMNRTDGHFLNISNALKNVATDVGSMRNSLASITSLSGLNAAVGLVNLGFSVYAFQAVTSQLNEISSAVQSVSSAVVKLNRNEKNKAVEQYEKIILEANTIADLISNHREPDLKKLELYLNDFYAFMHKLCHSIYDRSLDLKDMPAMLLLLLKLYTMILTYFLTEYYEAYGRMPSNYDTYISIYDELFSDNFERTLTDYLFLSMDCSNRETTAAVAAVELSVVDCRSEVDDRVNLLQTLKTKEKMEEYDRLVDQAAQKQMEELSEQVAMNLQKDPAECLAVLQAQPN